MFRNITELGTMFEIVFFMDRRGQFLLYKKNWFSCSPSCSQFRNISKISYCEIRDTAKLGTFAIIEFNETMLSRDQMSRKNIF
ncbi:hypothetical protein C0J52_07961 [Blattella germanica]|nr:hypothetical protein C0J52_07961 [Blattella germanica]